MGFYVYRKYYFPQARTYWQALTCCVKQRKKDFFMGQWAKEEKMGWIEVF